MDTPNTKSLILHLTQNDLYRRYHYYAGEAYTNLGFGNRKSNELPENERCQFYSMIL